ncbi:MAG: ChbG/HpnK family deacetylase [Desulfovibrio sp.]|jgi:predicted glycoside hydrolase/deacetylase ChbG (UPF0249 family)|nr:ChbG/HpnK family deacetylase [Desulfovibrio sp.]
MRIIINADDCGLTRGISGNILHCLDHGPLNSTTVMTGGYYAAETLTALSARPGILVGLHLNILEGRPTAPAALVAPLLDGRGFFRPSLGVLYLRLHNLVPRARKALLSAMRTEFSAQIDFFRAHYRPLGASPALRLDGHLHIHAIPALGELMRELIREHRPVYVRLPYEPFHFSPLPPGSALVAELRRDCLAWWSIFLRRLLKEEGVAHNRFLAGVVSGGDLNLPRLRASLQAIKRRVRDEDVVEVMCHPGGYRADEEDANSPLAFPARYLSPKRSQEKEMLLSPDLPLLLAEFGASPRPAPTAGSGEI